MSVSNFAPARGVCRVCRNGEANLVNRTRNAIWASVTDSAAIMRSPSFSRSCESSAMINSPLSVKLTG